MPHKVFLLHGMGFNPDGWADELIPILKNFATCPIGGEDFDSIFKVIPLEYDSVLRRYLQTLQTRTQEVAAINQAFGPSLPTRWVANLADWAQQAPEVQDNFAWSHAFDVILYRFAPTLQAEIHAHLARSIWNEIKSARALDTWSVVAHSLGTVVCHDLCHRWFTSEIDGVRLGQHTRPNVIVQLANVSRLLQTTPKAYASTVRPGEACSHLISVLHPLDPITLLRRFEPVASAWVPKPADQARFRSLSVSHIHEVNIHSFAHYLRAPEVLTALFDALMVEGWVGPDCQRAYEEQFKADSKLTADQMVQVTDWLNDIRDGRSVPAGSMPPLVMAYKRALELIARLRDDDER